RSSSPGGIVTMALDNDFASPNSDSSRTSMGDGNFLVWGHNGLDATTWISTTAASGVPAGKDRLAREWLVQETGAVGAVNLQVNVDDLDLDLPAVMGVLYLLVDSDLDGDFGDETVQKMTAQGGGLYTISGVNFVSGQRFTFATPNSGIRGFVFQDQDVDGQRDANEEGLENITVTAVDANGVTASTQTDADGNYIFLPESGIQGSTRITFSLPSASGFSISAVGDDSTLEPTVFGRDSKTTANFVYVGSGWTVVNTGFALKDRPSDCAKPTVAVACYHFGDGDAQRGIFSFPFAGNASGGVTDAASQDIGSVWGGAFSTRTGQFFSAALLKRHVGLGPLAAYNGTDTYTVDGVYVIPYSGSTSAFNPSAPGFTLQGVSGVDLGTVQRHPDDNGQLDDDFELMATGVSIDQDAFFKAGTVGFGNADVYGGALWLVNVNQRALIQVATAGLPTNGSAAPAGNVTQYAIPDPGCSNGEFRPWALTFYNGLGYVGLVCTAETSQNRADLHAYIQTFDPSNVNGGFTTVLDFPLGYSRESARVGGAFGKKTAVRGWQPWVRTLADLNTPFATLTSYPQAILSDIDFTSKGDMLLSFMDRWGLQTTVRDPHPITSAIYTALTAGDLMTACARGSNTWVIEGDAGCRRFAERGGLGRITNDGPFASGEFFWGDTHMQCHGGNLTMEDFTGAACVVGQQAIVTNYGTFAEGSSKLYTPGLRRIDTRTGKILRFYSMNACDELNNAIGEPVCMCSPLPVEIGNRVWKDYDLDGEQDPDEPPIAGVTVELIDSGNTVIATAITDARGEFYFSSYSGTDTANFKHNLAIPSSGVSVRIPNADGGSQQAPLVGLLLTAANQGTDDRVDSDATLSGSAALIPAVTGPGTIDHSFDFGFAPDNWDLALRKSVPVQYVASSSTVIFTIDIFNQGGGPVDNIEIIDYVPANLSVNDANWTPNTLTGPGTVTRMLTAGSGLPAGGLWPGESVSIDISMDVAGSLADNTVIVNKAEIANMTARNGSAIVDKDSTPDSTDGETNIKDDVITEDGKAGGDEDDHDIARITVTAQTDIYDLALRKQLAAGQPSIVNAGEDVRFTIELFNQGTSPASSITLVDRYPVGFSLSPNEANWTDQGGTTATYAWTGTLMPGQSVSVDIILRAGATLGTMQNYTEIQSDDGNDVDSQPESDENDNNGDALLDDVISDNGAIDEDDHDVAEVTVQRFDLALRKQLAAGQPTTTVKGADVTYVIDVFNQGSVDAFDIKVVDYLTDTLALSENDSNGW
ncbi:MAG: DUF11 domain-containing protein, partial [Caldilineaceae bacterium]|nr:DUF11 domain-containing protein [Caldilineaceae bacterium]